MLLHALVRKVQNNNNKLTTQTLFSNLETHSISRNITPSTITHNTASLYTACVSKTDFIIKTFHFFKNLLRYQSILRRFLEQYQNVDFFNYIKK